MTQTRAPVDTTRRPSSRRPGIADLVGAGYALLGLAALAAWAIVGDTGWMQPVNLTTFWWSLPAVPLVVAAVVLRRWRLAAWLTLPALVWVWSYGTAFLPQDAAAAADLRVATFNTYVRAPDAAHVLDLVAAEAPDVLLVQEVFPDRQAELETQLGDRYPHQLVVQSEGVGGVGVLSRFPIVDRRAVGDASRVSRSTVVVTLDVDGQPLQVVPVHLISPCPRCGTGLLERLELEGVVRAAEMSAVLDALDPEVPAVVGGDFNSTERSEPYRRLVAAGFRDPQRDVGSGLGFTWPNGGSVPPVFRIDWLLTRGVEPVRAVVASGGSSDHRPVLVDLSLPGSSA